MDRGSETTVRVALLGDIGGHAAELRNALDALGCDTEAGTVPDRLLVVQVGDLIDRGPDSAEVVRLAESFIRNAGSGYVQLFGNHEGQRFTDLHLKHVDPLPDATLATIHRWWSTRRAHLAIALDTDQFGPLLVTHAGLSPAMWRSIGSPDSARKTAEVLNAWVGTDADRAFTPPPRSDDRSFRPGVTWGEPADLYTAWLTENEPPPFAQVHGHASAWSWKRDRWRKSTPSIVRDAPVDIDGERRHLRVEIRGKTFVGIDPGHLETPRKPWSPLLLTARP
jgi:hypothetical protein